MIYYLATPYSLYPEGLERAFVEASRIAGILMKRGLVVFCPIAHTHPISIYGEIEKVDHDFWLNQDIALLDRTDALLVVKMPGWDKSHGVRVEIDHAEKTGKPVSYLSWPLLEEVSK